MSSSGGPLFSSFRLESEESDQAERSDKVRKRQRKILSCEQCHRSKVKCDRNLPCQRCKALGKPDQCSYADYSTSLPKSPQASGSVTPSREAHHKNPEIYYTKGIPPHAGLTNWVRVASEFAEAREFVFGQSDEFKDAWHQLVQLRELYPPQTSYNLPFSPTTSGVSTKEDVLQALPQTAIVKRLVDNYMLTFNKTHRLFHPPQLDRELSHFNASPGEYSNLWLAQLFALLSLSCKSAPQSLMDDFTQTDRESMSRSYLLTSETSLNLSAWMAFPDLAAIRTLCMMIIIKTFDADTPVTIGGLSSLMGFLVRTAMSIHLHKDPATFPMMQASEAETRKRIWNTIVYLELNVAIDSGMLPSLRPNDWDSGPPANLDDHDIERMFLEQVDFEREVLGEANVSHGTGMRLTSLSEAELTDASLQIILSETYETVAAVISIVNSAAPMLEYARVLEWDSKLKGILSHVHRIFDRSAAISAATNQADSTTSIQHILIEAFVRRTLLALHQMFAGGSERNVAYETSHWSVLECSLAMMGAQQRLDERFVDTDSIMWFSGLIQPDFAIAMGHVILGLRRGDFSHVSSLMSERPPKQTTWIALKASLSILEVHTARSFHNFKVYFGLRIAVAVLEAIEANTSHLEAARNAVQEIVKTVRRHREPYISTRVDV